MEASIPMISDKGNGKEARCNGRTESNGYDEMNNIRACADEIVLNDIVYS